MERVGALVISLDFELLWGVFDKVDHTQKQGYFHNTRELIPQLLDLFSQYQIHTTWATVGMLFNESWNHWEANIPKIIPQYTRTELSAYNYGHSIKNKATQNLCMARDLIELIHQTPNQEVATHTYSHYYCLEKGQSLEAFSHDLEMCVSLAQDMGITLRSLVFPRNQFNAAFLKVCKDLGIENVRSNPGAWYWNNTQRDTIQDKIFRTADAYIGLKDKSYPFSQLMIEDSLPLAQKASRLLRPYSSKKWLNQLKIKRIKSEMLYAARHGQIYHLWWHPHNLASYPQENLRELRELLDYFKFCQHTYGFQSRNMAGINALVKKKVHFKKDQPIKKEQPI